MVESARNEGAHNMSDIQKLKTWAFNTWAFKAWAFKAWAFWRAPCKRLGRKWVELAGAAP